MPTFNGGAYVDAALASVASEEDPGIEVIVVDDGSDDDTVERLAVWSRRLRLQIHERKIRNWVANTNMGLSHAKAPLACFLHQDDLWLPGRAAAVRGIAESQPQGRLYLHSSKFIDANGRTVGVWRCPLPKIPLDVGPSQAMARLLVQNWISIPAPVFRVSDVMESGGLDEELWYTADWDLWLRLAGLGPVVYDPVPRTAFRVHGSSLTMKGSRRLDDYRQQMTSVFNRHCACWTPPSAAEEARVRAAALAAIEVNVALAAVASKQRPSVCTVAAALNKVGPLGLGPFMARTRLRERLGARLRVGFATRLLAGPKQPKKKLTTSTQDVSYSERLQRLQLAPLKSRLRFADPYRAHFLALRLGRTLEVGCGVGRVLDFLRPNAVGVDHNVESVRICNERGLEAHTPEDFMVRYGEDEFESLVFSHVLEHMKEEKAVEVLGMYLPYLRKGGRVILITPQERGQKSDPTHVTFMDHDRVASVCAHVGLNISVQCSFPLPRPLGRFFLYNEFVTVATKK